MATSLLYVTWLWIAGGGVGDLAGWAGGPSSTGRIEMIFLDGAKEMYREVLQMLEPRLAPGAIVAADNASRAAGCLDHVRSSDRYLSANVGGDVEVTLLA